MRHATARLTSLAPQLLVNDLARAIAYYERLGFTFGEPWEGFYAIGTLDGFELHLKQAAKSDAERRHRQKHEHLDATAGVAGIESFHERCVANGATILKALAPTAWGTKDFYVVDPDGNVIAFGVDGRGGKEGVVVVAETRTDDPTLTRKWVAERVRQTIGLPPRDIILVAPGTLPKTSSGKLQRSLCRERYLGEELEPV